MPVQDNVSPVNNRDVDRVIRIETFSPHCAAKSLYLVAHELPGALTTA
jgi:hypothetical protein